MRLDHAARTSFFAAVLALGAWGCAFGAALLGAAGPARAQEASPLGVLELFTSQGCASCPAADALLGAYAAQGGVLALSLSVDYWDYLGWEDTLATLENSARQRAYAEAMGAGEVFTPQIVVNGRRQVVGNDADAVAAAIAELGAAGDGLRVPVGVGYDRERVVVTVGTGTAAAVPATIWLVFFTTQTAVAVERGENAGHTLAYSNVVREMQPIGTWWGAAMTVEVPLSEVQRHAADGCAVLVQLEAEGQPGPIIGAGMAALPEPVPDTAAAPVAAAAEGAVPQ